MALPEFILRRDDDNEGSVTYRILYRSHPLAQRDDETVIYAGTGYYGDGLWCPNMVPVSEMERTMENRVVALNEAVDWFTRDPEFRASTADDLGMSV